MMGAAGLCRTAKGCAQVKGKCVLKPENLKALLTYHVCNKAETRDACESQQKVDNTLVKDA